MKIICTDIEYWCNYTWHLRSHSQLFSCIYSAILIDRNMWNKNVKHRWIFSLAPSLKLPNGFSFTSMFIYRCSIPSVKFHQLCENPCLQSHKDLLFRLMSTTHRVYVSFSSIWNVNGSLLARRKGRLCTKHLIIFVLSSWFWWLFLSIL